MNTESVTVVFNGFLNLNGKEKLALVEAINEYFDSNDRGRIRAEHDAKFNALVFSKENPCKCCNCCSDRA